MISPGTNIKDILNYRGIRIEEFTDQMKLPEKDINSLLNGHRKITKKIARQLHLVIGGSINYWLELDNRYWSSILGNEFRRYKRIVNNENSDNVAISKGKTTNSK